MRRTMLSVSALLVLCLPRVSLAQTTPVSPPSARFDATAVRYEVPASNTSGGFFAAAMGTTNKHWLLYDMNADGKPDLVQTRDPGNPDAVFGVNVKNEHWRVWSGTPTPSASTTTADSAAALGDPHNRQANLRRRTIRR